MLLQKKMNRGHHSDILQIKEPKKKSLIGECKTDALIKPQFC